MTVLAVFVALFGIGMGALTGRSNRLLGVVFALGGLAAGWFIYSTDSTMRRQTLFEAMAEGSTGVAVGAEAPVRRLTFDVEHPGTEHTLMVAPSMPPPHSPGGPVDVETRLFDPQGKLLVEDARTYQVRGSGRNSRPDWEAASFPFTPAQAGTHTLELTLLTVDIPRVHLRVEDPLKTDGQRIPGY